MQETCQHQVSSARLGTKIIAVLACLCIQGMSMSIHYITLAKYVELFLCYELYI